MTAQDNLVEDNEIPRIRRGAQDKSKKQTLMVREIIEVDISLLKPHPRNEEIYGNENVSDLVALIEERGRIVTPLVIKKDNTIISGHRRWLAAQQLVAQGLEQFKTVPCEIVEFNSDEEEMEELIHYNAGRDKTFEQRIRESITLEEIYSTKAKKRSIDNLKQNKTDMDNLTTSEDAAKDDPTGATRDIVASKAGISSGKTYERGKKVILVVDRLRKNGNNDDADLLITILKNKSVSAAADLADESVLNSLSEDDKTKLKRGGSVRSVIPKRADDEPKKKPPTEYATVKGYLKDMTTMTMALKKVGLTGASLKQSEKIREDVESIINSLQELLSDDQRIIDHEEVS